VRKPSPALVVALAALFFAVGGPSWAAAVTSAAKTLITGKQIKDGSIGETDLDKKVSGTGTTSWSIAHTAPSSWLGPSPGRRSQPA
jgi:hypothetical protein